MLPFGSCMAGLVAKRKRGAGFVYLQNPCKNKRGDTPRSNRYGVLGTQNAPCHDLNKNECCSSSSYMLKTATFSVKDSAKTLSIQYVRRSPCGRWQ